MAKWKIALLAIAAFALGSVLSIALNIGGPRTASEGSASSGSEEAAQSAENTDAGSETASASTDETAPTPDNRAEGPVDGTFDFVDECLDANGFPTVYAFCELKGWQFNTLLDQEGWSWTQQGEVGGWTNPAGTAAAWFSDDDGAISIEDMNELGQAGAGEETRFTVVMSGYSQAGDVLNSMTRCSIEDYEVRDDTFAIAVAYGPSMNRVLVVIDQTEDGQYKMDVYNAEAIDDGMYNNGSFGYTFSEVFRTLAGRELGSR